MKFATSTRLSCLSNHLCELQSPPANQQEDLSPTVSTDAELRGDTRTIQLNNNLHKNHVLHGTQNTKDPSTLNLLSNPSL